MTALSSRYVPRHLFLNVGTRFNGAFLSLQLKELLSERNEGVAVSQLCLIFAGKILKDDESLEKQGVKDGLTIHMVIRSGGAKVCCQRNV